jgi:dTDP-4-amino-4,6-dideoxygalactose transaminase
MLPREMPDVAIPFNRPRLEGRELEYMAEAMGSGHISSDGPFANRVKAELRAWFEAEDVILTTSCTDALELAALLLDFEPGDEVIVPSFTFVSTALAFARAGATLVFGDIEDRYLSLDPSHVASLINDRTRAVVTVHYAGIGGPVNDLVGLTAEQLTLIEDNAHGLFGALGDKKLGTFGRFSTLSFHETKNFTCGEGGALIVNHAADSARAHILTDKGTNRRAFFRGEVDKYTWQDIGSSFGLSDLLAAFLLGQLEQRDRSLGRRKEIFERYLRGLEPLVAERGIRVPAIPTDAVPAYHLFYFLTPTGDGRSRVLSHLREQGVNATFHYVPLHTSNGAKRFSINTADLPVTDSVSERLIRLPFHNHLSDTDIDRVISVTVDAIRNTT